MLEVSLASLQMHIYNPFLFNNPTVWKYTVLKSTVYNLHKGYNIQVLRKYINFWNHKYKWIITKAVALPENESNGATVKYGF